MAGILMPWALVAVLLGAAPEAGPDAPVTERSASTLAHQAIADYNAGEYEKALAETEAAYKQDPRPGLVYNLAQCHRALQHWERAEFFYRDYLEQVPKAPNRSSLLKLIEELAALRVSEKLGPRPPPQPALLVVPLVVPAPPVVAPAPPAAPPQVVDAAVPDPFAERVVAPMPHRAHVWPWLLGGVAAGAIAVGVWGLLQVSSFDSLKSQSQTSNIALTQLLDAQGSAQTGEVLGVVGLIAAAGLGTGAVLTW
jgi:tetratricopeptide (TPR) repeat protein